MADIRYVRPPSDNKIRNNIEFHQPTGIIQVSAPQVETLHENKPSDSKQEPPWNMFITSWSEQTGDQNKETTGMNAIESHSDISSDAFKPETNETDEAPEKNVLLPQVESTGIKLRPGDSQQNDDSDSTKESKVPPQNNDHNSDDNSDSKNMRADTIFPQKKEEIPNKNKSHENLSNTTFADSTASVLMETSFHKCYVGYVISSFVGNTESGLVDVKDEETEKLPEVPYKGTAFTPQLHRCTKQAQGPNFEKNGNHTDDNRNTLASSRNVRNIPKSPRKLWRSISEASIIRENSFFGSVKNADTYTPFYSSESDNDVDEIRIDVITAMKSHTKQVRVGGHGKLHRSAWELDTLHENGQKERTSLYERKHDTKSRHSSLKKKSVSTTPVEDFIDKNNEKNNSKKKEEAVCTDRFEVIQEVADRLKMRRGALAEPEKMIMSQDVREKIERDVEKRKTSMARRLSQFLNIQLGLNKEEDLI